jgi:hypothetical protein
VRSSSAIPGKKAVHFLVRRLTEIPVPEADGAERLGRRGAHDFVSFAGERFA